MMATDSQLYMPEYLDRNLPRSNRRSPLSNWIVYPIITVFLLLFECNLIHHGTLSFHSSHRHPLGSIHGPPSSESPIDSRSSPLVPLLPSDMAYFSCHGRYAASLFPFWDWMTSVALWFWKVAFRGMSALSDLGTSIGSARRVMKKKPEASTVDTSISCIRASACKLKLLMGM